MSNARFLYLDRIAAATVTSDSTVASLPPSNVKSPIRGIVYASNGATSAYLQADLGATYSIDSVFVGGANWSAAATWRIRLSTVSNFASAVLDTGGSQILTGVDTALRQAAYLFSSPGSGRYVRIDMTDASLSRLEVGVLRVGLCWRPSYNFRYGHRTGVADFSRRDVTDGGNTWVDVVATRPRTVSLTMQVTEAEAEGGEAELMARTAGISGDVVAFLDPAASDLARRTYCGLLESAAVIQHDHKPIRYMELTLMERF